MTRLKSKCYILIGVAHTFSFSANLYTLHLMNSPPPPSNLPEFTVSELSARLRGDIEETYAHVRIRGELSKVMRAKSGHIYTTLKDENAVLDSVIWKGVAATLSISPDEGLEVVATGRLTTYPMQSKYQLVIERLELAGVGALLKMLEDRKKKLAAEGLFDPSRKVPLPFMPTVIGVVTSPTGAVIRDILHRLADRFPVRVLVWPTLVQGQQAAAQITAAINGFNGLDSTGGIPVPDVLIVARGGGSLEDLMPFNEETVVRAVAASRIPIITAVGHETDTTLVDFAADVRAPTPTGAAEMVVPVQRDLQLRILELHGRLQSAAVRGQEQAGLRLKELQGRLRHPRDTLRYKAQLLDHGGLRLGAAWRGALEGGHRQMGKVSGRLVHPKALIVLKQTQLQGAAARLNRTPPMLLQPRHDRLQALAALLNSYSYRKTLERGFVLVQNAASGQPITSVKGVQAGMGLHLQFADGVAHAVGGGGDGSLEGYRPPSSSTDNKTASFAAAAKPDDKTTQTAPKPQTDLFTKYSAIQIK